jgi:uncharacterized protein YjbI with pentapeptide repeats
MTVDKQDSAARPRDTQVSRNSSDTAASAATNMGPAFGNAKGPARGGRDVNAISDDELQGILDGHVLWLRSFKRRGKQADLSKRDLRGRLLQDIDLSDAIMRGTDLSRAHLENVNLHRTDMDGAMLGSARLKAVNMRQAKLGNVNLRRATLEKVTFRKSVLRNAILKKAFVTRCDFTETDLEGADLRDAIFEHTKLVRADFQHADLTDARFGAPRPTQTMQAAGAGPADEEEVSAPDDSQDEHFDADSAIDMRYAKFHHARLYQVDLRNTVGLEAQNLAGADLLNATLPASLSRFSALEQVESVSHHARQNFLVCIGICIYSLLTIAMTKDVDLFLTTRETTLPIIETGVPIRGFFQSVPFLLLSLYLYLHLYLERMWRAMAALPAIFPDGRPLDEGAYPWLLNSIIPQFVPRLRQIRKPLWWLGFSLSVLFAWVLVPVTMALYWIRYLPIQDFVGTALQVGCLAATLLAGVVYYRITATLLGGSQAKNATAFQGMILNRFSFLPRHFFELYSRPLMYGLLGLFALVGISYLSFEGILPGQYDRLEMADESFIGADLNGRNLQNADLRRADFTNADLRFADLSGANLQGANFSGANLLNAVMLNVENLDAEQLAGSICNNSTALNNVSRQYCNTLN